AVEDVDHLAGHAVSRQSASGRARAAHRPPALRRRRTLRASRASRRRRVSRARAAVRATAATVTVYTAPATPADSRMPSETGNRAVMDGHLRVVAVGDVHESPEQQSSGKAARAAAGRLSWSAPVPGVFRRASGPDGVRTVRGVA